MLLIFFDQDTAAWGAISISRPVLEQIDKDKAPTLSIMVGQSGKWRSVRVALN